MNSPATIILITYKSGMTLYFKHDKDTLDYIIAHFDSITDVQIVEFGGAL